MNKPVPKSLITGKLFVQDSKQNKKNIEALCPYDTECNLSENSKQYLKFCSKYFEDCQSYKNKINKGYY